MNERFLDHVFTEYLHPVSGVFRCIVTGCVYPMIIDGPQQLPHCEFVHQGLELIVKREGRRLIALFPFLGGSGRPLHRSNGGVGCGMAQPEHM
jgi:hypothetical protein